MNLLERARKIPRGMEVISEWLGSGGEVVSQDEAQGRADICLRCPKNTNDSVGFGIISAVVKSYLRVKNRLGLHVSGEKSLHACECCGCVLKLKIWLPQDKVSAEMAGDDRTKYPDYCWQLK